MGSSGSRQGVGVAAVVAALLLAGCGGPMKRSELADSVETLDSTAAEGSLLASEAARGRSKTTFVRVRARELGEVADHEAEKLTDAEPANGVGADKERAVELAGQISTELGTLQTAPEDPASARDVSDRLKTLTDAAKTLGERL
jgi:hypothetical protein